MLFATSASLGLADPATSPQSLPASSPETAPLDRPLSLKECTELALRHNGDLARARYELEAAHGVALQLRSVALPSVKVAGDYLDYRERKVDSLALPLPAATHLWTASIRVVQPIYEGGRLQASLKISTLTRQEALARFQAIAADKILEVRTAYLDLQLARARLQSEQSAVDWRSRELQEAKSRLGTGLTERHELMRAEVEAARSRQALLRAQNQFQLDQVRFIQLLGFNPPAGNSLPAQLQLADALQAPTPTPVDLPASIARALQNRPELEAQARQLSIEEERLQSARGGYKPSIQLLGGYGGFNDDLDRKVTGWFAGAQLNWNLFDGQHTQGKVREARGRHSAADARLGELKRTVALEVRVAHSNLAEARELLDLSAKVQEMADEALRVAGSSHRAGGITAISLAAAQHSADDARYSTLRAWRDYHVAHAALERAIGLGVSADPAATPSGQN